jgi:5-bromo-4-chloroindolyl phosphate hydrolysis protein
MEPESQRDRELRAARNQSVFRAVNEKLRELNDAFSDVSKTYAIACECADVSCIETVQILMEEYIQVREDAQRFVVLEDHVYPEVERVVAQNDGYAIVEKNTHVSKITEARHPGGQ